jgi:hypothetical protein
MCIVCLITETACVYCAVRAEYLYIVQSIVSLKSVKLIFDIFSSDGPTCQYKGTQMLVGIWPTIQECQGIT